MTNTTDKAMREAFEAWAIDREYNIQTFEGNYYVSSTCAAWAAWQAALASSAAAPEQADEQPVLTTCNCRWSGDTQVQQCTLHEAHVQAIHEWTERAKTAEAASPLSAGSHRIDGLGRMTDDDDGFVTLQFVSEAAAEAFMARYEPTVDVDAMPPPSPQPTKEAMADLIRTAGHVTRSHAKMIADVLHAALSSPASSAGVDAQRLDAERYRWLRREVHGPRLPLAQVVWKQDGIRASSQWTNLCDGSSLDAHIDAAIASKEQP